jgi:RND superfamily putative drug exporter
LTVLVQMEHDDLAAREGKEQIGRLARRLQLDGVTAVRNVNDPLGDFSREERVGILGRGLQSRLVRAHRRTEGLFVSKARALAGKVARLELILGYDPFSVEAAEVLGRVEKRLRDIQGESGSYWRGAAFFPTGTTAAIRDLRAVTRSDNARIQRLVVLAVLGVLLLILKRPLICLYLIVTVLFSYYVTIGSTELFFRWACGPTFLGLDWRTPLFLFVILVAVGEDYNVYLVTRVFEEQSRHGPLAGLTRAVVRTGGIITSCGVIMAGTFLSMTSGTWGRLAPRWMPLPDTLFAAGGALPGIVELGFALALGVTLDTFIVRPVLVPAFLVLLSRWRTGAERASAAPAQYQQRPAKTAS